MLQRLVHAAAFLTALPFANGALRIACYLNVIEYAPQQLANEDYFNGSISITNGSVATLFSNSSVDLAANSETQSLRNYASHKNLRIIYTIAEVPYRIIAYKDKVKKAEDLKGKRIGAMRATSSAYFVSKYMASVGLQTSDYTFVNGDICTIAPCGNGTLPYMLANR